MDASSKESILLVFISVMVPVIPINFQVRKFYFALVVLSLIKPATRKKIFLA